MGRAVVTPVRRRHGVHDCRGQRSIGCGGFAHDLDPCLADKFLPTQGLETWREPAFFVRVEPHSAWTGRLHRSAELMLLVYERLRLLAKKLLRNESSGHTLQPTALVNEAYLRMVGQREMD